MNIVFFGTPTYGVTVLEQMKAKGFMPTLIVTQSDKPVGRKQIMTPPPVKVWADEHDIETIQPTSLKPGRDPEADILINSEWDLFVVAAYGLLLPQVVLDIPRYKTLNVHPSLLPKYRGASPIQTQILNDDRACGVTIMELDAGMDSGPVVAQASIQFEENDWPVNADILNDLLWNEGGKLLVETIPLWVAGEVTGTEQNHDEATFSKRFTKADGELDIKNGDPYQNYLKYCAFGEWPGTFFFVEKNDTKIRVKIKEADFIDGVFMPLRVVPEGKQEMKYEDFVKNL